MDAWGLWCCLALTLFLLELAFSGSVLVFVSAGALLVSFTSLIGLTPGLLSQVITCVLVSLVAAVLLRWKLRTWLAESIAEKLESEEENEELEDQQDVAITADGKEMEKEMEENATTIKREVGDA